MFEIVVNINKTRRHLLVKSQVRNSHITLIVGWFSNITIVTQNMPK